MKAHPVWVKGFGESRGSPTETGKLIVAHPVWVEGFLEKLILERRLALKVSTGPREVHARSLFVPGKAYPKKQ